MVGKVRVVTTGSLHVWRPGAGEGGDAVWVAVESSGSNSSNKSSNKKKLNYTMKVLLPTLNLLRIL